MTRSHSTLILLQGGAKDLLIVPCEDVPVGISRMGPIDGSHSLTTTIWLRCWFNELRASQLLTALGRQLGDDQFSVVVIDKETLAVSYQKATRPPCFLASDLQRLPEAFPGVKVQT